MSSLPLPTARSVAAHVLLRVIRDKAFASAALEAALESTRQLTLRDRALTTELVYGVLRTHLWLEAQLNRDAPRGIHKLDLSVRTHLFLAAYQITFLDRVPTFAAVDQAVEAIRRVRSKPLAGFANALLRKFAQRCAAEGPIDRVEVITTSTPAWLRTELENSLGQEGAAAFLAHNADPPPLCLRIEDPTLRDRWRDQLQEACPHATLTLGAHSPHALLLRGAGSVQTLPGWREGAWTVQEEGSQLIALSLGVQPGDQVLDACAGRGNKSTLLARSLQAPGALDAADLYDTKLDHLRQECIRLSLSAPTPYLTDWSAGEGEHIPKEYNRILVDAPCSGTGTIRRRPDLHLRSSLHTLTTLSALQKLVLTRAAGHARSGASMVYAVCSPLRQEGEEVVEAFLEASPDWQLVPFDTEPLRSLAGQAPCLRLLPHVHGTDGYFLAHFRKA